MLTKDITSNPSLKQKAIDLIFSFLDDNQAEFPLTFEAFKQESSPESQMNLLALLADINLKPTLKRVQSSIYEMIFEDQERIRGIGKATCLCNGANGVLVGCTDRNVYKVNNGTAELLVSLQSPVLSLSCNADKSIYVATSMDGKAITFDGSGNLGQELRQHSAYCAKSAVSDCGVYIAKGSHDKTALIYRKEQGSFTLVKTLNMVGIVESLVIHNTTAILGVRGDNYLHYFDLVSLCDNPVNMNENGDDWVSFSPMDVKVSPNSEHVAVYTDSKAGRAIIFKYGSSEVISSCFGMEIDDFSLPRLEFVSEEHLACTNYNKVTVFDIYSEKVVETLDYHEDVIRGIIVKDSSLFTCSFDCSVVKLPFTKYKI